MNEWLMKLWYIHTTTQYVEYYSAIKRNKLLIYTNLNESPEENEKWEKINPWFLLAKFLLSACFPLAFSNLYLQSLPLHWIKNLSKI